MLLIFIVAICVGTTTGSTRERVLLVEQDHLVRSLASATPPQPAAAAATAVTAAHTESIPQGPDIDVLVGVITNPPNFDRRKMLRDFGTQPGVADGRVHVEYVVGDRYYAKPPGHEVQQRVADEAKQHGDLVFVPARENLPHVGKATEKSAAWWLSAPLRSRARFFCKTDDDSLVHLSHLRTSLLTALHDAPTPHLLYSYVRWRGWLPGFRFQACGGGWGGPIDAIHHIEDPSSHCDLAEGPFPQGTGTLTCISRDLAVKMAQNDEFKAFYQVARVRNDFGTPCAVADECAKQPFGVHMWHHEDAGISYNVWRTVLKHKLHAALVHLPEKGWIWPWFHEEIKERQGSARGIIMHKVTPDLYEKVLQTWRVAEPAPRSIVDCSQRCSQWGWTYARKPCEEPPVLPDEAGWRGFVPPWNGSICKFDPSEWWNCCFLRAEGDK